MRHEGFLWDALPDCVKQHADHLAETHERRLEMTRDKLRMRLLLAASQNTDALAAMQRELDEIRLNLERWKASVREQNDERHATLTPTPSSIA